MLPKDGNGNGKNLDPDQTAVFKIRSSQARGYKTFFMLNLAEHEILNAHKYKNNKKFSFFLAQISL